MRRFTHYIDSHRKEAAGGWHATKTRNRDSILENGLDWTIGDSPYGDYFYDSYGGQQPKGNYFVQRPEELFLSPLWGPDEMIDVWWVDPHYLKTVNGDYILDSYLPAFSTPEPVPPEALTLVATGTTEEIRGMLEYPQNKDVDINPWGIEEMQDAYFFTSKVGMAVRPEDLPRFLYHATYAPLGSKEERDRVNSILKHGLIPQKKDGEYTDGFWTPRQGFVYLFDPNVYSGHLQLPQIIVDAKFLDPSKFVADEDAFYTWGVEEDQDHLPDSLKWENVPKEYVEKKRNYGEWADSVADDLAHEDMAEHSLKSMGTIAYEGPIPPEAISLNPKWHEMVQGQEVFAHVKEASLEDEYDIKIYTNSFGSSLHVFDKADGKEIATVTWMPRSVKHPGEPGTYIGQVGFVDYYGWIGPSSPEAWKPMQAKYPMLGAQLLRWIKQNLPGPFEATIINDKLEKAVRKRDPDVIVHSSTHEAKYLVLNADAMVVGEYELEDHAEGAAYDLALEVGRSGDPTNFYTVQPVGEDGSYLSGGATYYPDGTREEG